jgi:hypothetical protein
MHHLRNQSLFCRLCQVQKDLMRMIIANQQSLISESSLFARSKAEVLTNVRTRLSGWIVQAYEVNLIAIHIYNDLNLATTCS